jgi:hypothetical protein
VVGELSVHEKADLGIDGGQHLGELLQGALSRRHPGPGVGGCRFRIPPSRFGRPEGDGLDPQLPTRPIPPIE